VTLGGGDGLRFAMNITGEVLHENLLVMMYVFELVLRNAGVKLFVMSTHLH
jgi:hypothetical protein